jgi:CDGSH-type Zn-finger protein
MAEVKISMCEQGPYEVEGEIEMVGLDGEVIATKRKVFLCRCGASAHKPFCDGSHRKVGFEGASEES